VSRPDAGERIFALASAPAGLFSVALLGPRGRGWDSARARVAAPRRGMRPRARGQCRHWSTHGSVRVPRLCSQRPPHSLTRTPPRGRYDDVIDLTEGLKNDDDSSALLLTYRAHGRCASRASMTRRVGCFNSVLGLGCGSRTYSEIGRRGQGDATVNLSVFRRHPPGGCQHSVPLQIPTLPRCEQSLGTPHASTRVRRRLDKDELEVSRRRPRHRGDRSRRRAVLPAGR
jgi:hypothetical protein